MSRHEAVNRARVAESWLRVAPATALAVFGLVGLSMVASVPLTEMSKQSLLGNAGLAPFVLVFAIVGVLIATRKPRHPTGWILLGVALAFVINGDASLYDTLVYQAHRGLPLGWVSVLVQPAWAPAIVLFGLAALSS